MHLLATARFVLGTSLLTTLVACSTVSAAGGGGVRSIDDGQEFSMEIGERVMLADRANLRYIGVANDSRCMPDVQCIWAGDAEVQFEWSMGDATRTFSLHTGKDPKQQTLGERRLALVSLARGDAPEVHLRIERSP